MANSIVKVTDVTDNAINNSLLLLVGEDGTVTPDRRTVDNYLNSKSGPTNLQIMHIDKCDQKGIDVIVDNVMYVPDNMDVNKNKQETQKDIKLIEANLHNIQLDHDYSRLTMLKNKVQDEDEDELAKTLSILDGNDEELIHAEQSSSNNIQKTVDMLKVLPSSSSSQQLFINKKNNHKESLEEEPSAKAKGKLKVIRPLRKSPGANKKGRKLKKLTEHDATTDEDTEEEEDDVEEEEEADEDEDFDMEMEDHDDDDDNDSDFEIQGEETIKKLARISGRYKTDTKQQNKQLNKSASDGRDSSSKLSKGKFNRKRMFEEEEAVDKPLFKIDKEKLSTKSEEVSPSESKIDKSADTAGIAEENKPVEKKPKKKKEPPKPIPGDFALFSTPDIIRKVSKEATTPETLTNKSTKPHNGDYSSKPGRITQESRSKSSSECSTSLSSKLRLSLEERDREKTENSSIIRQKRKSIEKSTERRSAEESDDNLKLKEYSSESLILNSQNNKSSSSIIISGEDIVGTIPLSEVSLQSSNSSSAQDPNGIITLDSSGLDLDQAILDNINNDLISEDILYQVAKQLVSNTELQNAIDKGINEGVLVDTSGIHQQLNVSNISQESSNTTNTSFSEDQVASTAASSPSLKEGTQIVRSDGRILVLPPIERPTTRSRNKKPNKDEETPPSKSSSFKEPSIQVDIGSGRITTHHKPLDEEHVSGNELDTSDDDDDEEESEDDPNKLWCICNQPHNNRFMICCDTCEEWYHGKCVNITKSMGQQMESDGKEWICLFCKDLSLKRPLAAAKRIRKASRNSRQSTDSASTTHSSSVVTKKKTSVNNPQLMPCVVCQKTARKSSIYCSEECILAHAQGIERVVVFERSTGRMLTGNKAPSASELNQWLKNHPGYEVVKSGGKIVTTKVKSGHVTQSKLKIVKNPNNHGVSLAIQQKGVNIGVLTHSPKHSSPQLTPKTAKIINKTIQKDSSSKESKIKLIKPQPMPNASIKPKEHQTSIIKKIQIKTISTRVNPASIIPSASATTKILKSSTPIKEIKLKTPTPKMRLKDECGGQPKAKEDIRDNVQKTVFEQLIVRLKDSEFTLIEDEIKRISIEIEAELYKCFGDTGQKYKNKYRSLIFNIKDPKNQTLWRRICERSISSYELVRLSPDDMASQELAKWREQEAKHQLDMIKKSEIELLNCNRQYVLKTHKGEEVLEDTRVGTKEDHTDIIKSLTEGSPLDPGSEPIKHLIIKENEKNRDNNKRANLKHNNNNNNNRRDKGRSSSSRKRSRSRTRHDNKNSKKGGSGEKRSRSKSSERDKNRERHNKKLSKISRHNKISATNTNSSSSSSSSSSVTDNLDKRSKEILEHLNKIAPPPAAAAALENRLWKHVPQEDIIISGLAPADSDSDNEVPTSTVTIPTPPRVLETEEDGSISEPSDDSKPSTSRSSINKETEVVESSQGDQSGSLSPPPPPPPPPNKKNISTQIWSGTINMVDVAQISITAHEVSGDCVGLSKELCPNLDIVGRISPDTVWDYIGKMRSSNSKLISLLKLNATNVEEQMPYLALYSYLSSRNRLGVVKSTNKAIKDFYILPLAAQKPIPQALLPISGPVKQWLEANMKKINDRMQNGFEESRPALLLGIIVRDKRKRSYLDNVMPQTYHQQHKKQKIEVHVIQTNHPVSRSYTPPPVTPELATSSNNKLDPRSVTKVVPLPVPPPDVVASTSSSSSSSASVNMSDITKIMSFVNQQGGTSSSSSLKSKVFEVAPSTTADGDEPYSPGDSDPDTAHHSLITESYVPIPGLGDGIDLSAKKINFQRQMEELNKQIEMQKSEISSITKNIAATAESEIVGNALASIALPSNLQQILDSIKTIGNSSSSTSNTNNIENIGEKVPSKSDLTIPLLIPKTFTRSNTTSMNNDTIPLNLPSTKLKFSPPSSIMSRSPLRDAAPSSTTTSGSVLSSLSEADLIKKAAEMLKEQENGASKKTHHNQPSKKSKMEISLPPVPGVDD